MVVDAAIVGAGHGTQFCAAILGLKGFHLLRAVVGEAILQVDPCQRRGQLSQVGRRSADNASELTKGPMRGSHRFMRFRQDQVQPLWVVARGLDADVRRLHHTAAAALGPALHRCPKIFERDIPLVIGPV